MNEVEAERIARAAGWQEICEGGWCGDLIAHRDRMDDRAGPEYGSWAACVQAEQLEHVIPLGLAPIVRHRGGIALPQPTDWLAVVFGHEGKPLPMALAGDRHDAIARAMRQYAGTSPTLQAHYRERIVLIGVSPDEASELAEFFAAPWESAT
jgi:hypothetical protein